MLSIASSTAYAQQSCSAASLGDLGALNGWVPSPNDAWHQDISASAVDPNSTTIVSSSLDLAGAYLHPDFSTPADGGYGIPYTVVDSSTIPLVSITASDPGDSDATLYPLTSTTAIEGSPGQCWSDGNDHHAIVIDKNQCVGYEVYQADLCNGSWTSYGNVVWDFSTTEQRPYGMSSTDAAGLSVFEGLIRYDEIVAGSINHAIRFTALHTKSDPNLGYFTAPATHASGNNSSTDNIMGMRIRLKANFDVSSFSSTNQIILTAMKKYGMILADNGSNMFFQGTPDSRWNDSDLHALTSIPSTAFEVVQMGPVYDASTAPKGPAPVINSFTPSSATVSAGSSVTLTSNVSGASYQFIDKAGFTRGSVTVSPTQTTTYTLTARNAYGSSTASTTVTVSSAAATTLAFNPIATVTYGVAPFAISATSNSPGAITYTVVSGPATVSGNTVTVTGAGTVTVRATQAASGSYASATTTTSFTVVAAASASAGSTSSPASSASTTATTSSSTSTTSGSTSTSTGSTSTTSAKAQPALSLSYANGKGGVYQLVAKSNSPGAITYSVVSGSGTIYGNYLFIAQGNVTVRATQAASGNYTAATATVTVP